ncbi:MAG: hypothetical protein KDC46_12585 [Thermoleophilia bacterium]|nr:hypothetical protein [Thermoleophilia bacterium]
MRPRSTVRMTPTMSSSLGERTKEMKTVLHEELSHGLRTPLTSVLGYAGTLLEQWEDLGEDDRMEFVRIVYGEALRMAHSVEALDRQLYHEFAVKNARSGAFKGLHGLADAS